MQSKTILYFDSGIGGLSIYNEVNCILPNVNTIYTFDNEFFPYGNLPEQTVIDRCLSILDIVLAHYSVDIIVIACNTASTIVLPKVREFVKIPVVGVVPAIKPAASLSVTKTIGLLATPATVQRNYTKNLIEKYAADCRVISIGDPNLVKYAEQKLINSEDRSDEIANVLKPFIECPSLDTIVLGCTHYPWLKHEIQKVLPNVNIIDSGKAVAQRVKFLLDTDLIEQKTSEKIAFMTTKNVNNFINLKKMFEKMGFKSLKSISDLCNT